MVEAGRQLGLKEEEIVATKKRFKEERNFLEQDKKKLTSQLEECKQRLETAEPRFYQFKKEMDDSPINVLRHELGLKSLEIIELDNKLKLSNEQRDDFKKKFEQVKKDMITLKRNIDNEKS